LDPPEHAATIPVMPTRQAIAPPRLSAGVSSLSSPTKKSAWVLSWKKR
jgi:hypothetical protein